MSELIDRLITTFETTFEADASSHVRATGAIDEANLQISKSAAEATKRMTELTRALLPRAQAPAAEAALIQALTPGPSGTPPARAAALAITPTTPAIATITAAMTAALHPSTAQTIIAQALAPTQSPAQEPHAKLKPKRIGQATDAIEYEMASERHRLERHTLGVPAQSSPLNRHDLPSSPEYDKGVSQIELYAIRSSNRAHTGAAAGQQARTTARTLSREATGLGKLIEQAIEEKASAIAHLALEQFMRQNYGR